MATAVPTFTRYALATLGLVPRSAGLHAVTTGAFGTMTLAVMTRASLGHTGRALVAGHGTVAIYLLVTAASILRVLAPFAGDAMDLLLAAGAACWTAAFALFAILYGRLLLRPRARKESPSPPRKESLRP